MSNLSSVKAGDKVFTTYGWNGLKVVKVERVTKLHVIIEGGLKYGMTGRKVGSGTWSSDYIRPYDEQTWLDYKQERANAAILRALSDFNWKNLDIETARKIHALLPAPPEAE